MSQVMIKVRPNGPLVIDGPITIVDHLGNAFTPNQAKPMVALCRCGQSNNRPFCDGTHSRCGFVAEEVAPLPAES